MACPAMGLSLYLVSVVGDPSSMGVHFFQLGRKFPERWEYVLCTCRKNTSKVSYYNDNDGDDDDGGVMVMMMVDTFYQAYYTHMLIFSW